MNANQVATLLLAALLMLPRPVEAQTVPPRITPDVVYGRRDGMALTLDVFHSQAPANGAGVVFIMSAGWVSQWQPPDVFSRNFTGLLSAGFTVFIVRHGSSPRYKVPEAASDVERAIRFIRLNASAYGVDPQRLGVFGRSAGGQLALLLALDSDGGKPSDADPVLRTPSHVAAVVAMFPPVDLRGLEGPAHDPSKAEAVSPLLFVGADDPPALLIHGDADDVVEISHSERMFAALKQFGVTAEFVRIPGGEHNLPDPAHTAQAQTLMREWFLRYLVRR